jgi:hypothetical protein
MTRLFWLRLYFLFVLAQALLVGCAIVQPAWITVVLPWPASPLNARFIATLYLMGAITALLGLFARHYAEMRIALIQIGWVTGVLLLITLPHVGEFTPTTFPYRWVIFYTLDPIATGLLLWRWRGRDPSPAGFNRFAPLFLSYTSVLGVCGVLLLVLPTWASRLWPWMLPPILGQVYSVFLLTCALGGWFAAHEPRWSGVRIYVLANLGMLLLIIGVSRWHADRFGGGLATWIWYGICITGVFGLSAAVLRQPGATTEGLRG